MKVNFDIADIMFIMPIIALFLASLIPLTLKVLKGNKEPAPMVTVSYCFIGLVAALVSALATYSEDMTVFRAFSGALVFDGVSTFSTLITVFATGITLILARDNVATRGNQFCEFVFLLMNAAVGMLILAWSNDLIVTFIGIEIMSLCLYLIIAMSNEGTLSKEAAFKYFVLGSFASAIFLYGIAFMFGTAGTTYLDKITDIAPELISTSRMFLFGVAMVVVGFCFKVAIAPFHSWAPDVYQGAPTPLTGFMATGVKVVTFVAFLRVITTEALLGNRAETLIIALQWLAVITIMVGNIAAIMQNNVKRILAYSSVAHSGYVMIGLIAAGIGGQSWLGASGVIFYIFAYTLMTLGAFAVVCMFERREDSIVQVDDLRGLARKSPWLAACFAIFLLSLAGIPPLVGFFGKFFLFSAAIKQGLFWLAIWGVIGSVISVYYYLRPIVIMYMKDEEGLEPVAGGAFSSFAVVFSAGLVVMVGLLSDPFYQFVVASVDQLF